MQIFNSIFYNTVTCGDGIIQSVFGEQCDDGNTAGGDGCNQYWYTESGYNWINYSTKPSFWYPIWGDKTIQTSPILEECDDGNNMNYDGWSANWKVEANYVCSTNSQGYSDWAIQHSPPNAIGSSLDIDSHQITIEFDQIMLNQSITNTDIKLEIDGPNSPYITSWTSNFYQKLLIISFSSSPVLIGGKDEVITIKLENILKFKNKYYTPIVNEKTFELDVPNFSINPKVQSVSNGASYAFLLTMLLSICVSILTGGSIELMWSFANTIQMLFFISALDLYFPQDLIYVFSLMKYSNFDNPLFSYIREELFIMPNFFSISSIPYFENIGYSYPQLMMNYIGNLILIALLLISVATIKLLKCILKDKDTKLAQFIKKKDIELWFQGLTRFFVEIVLNLAIVIFINLTYGVINDAFSIVSLIISIYLACYSFNILIYSFAYVIYNHQEIVTHPNLHERHSLLFSEFK